MFTERKHDAAHRGVAEERPRCSDAVGRGAVVAAGPDPSRWAGGAAAEALARVGRIKSLVRGCGGTTGMRRFGRPEVASLS
jgi:hypothetical protein